MEDDQNVFIDFNSVIWTGKEILRIIPIYKKYIKELFAATSNKEKRRIWDKISSEMVMVGDRKCNPYLARMKIMNLKKTWKKHANSKSESKWRYFKQVDEIMKLEEKAIAGLLGNGAVDSSPDEAEEEEITVKKRKRKIDEEPTWFVQYRNDAEKRHEEKMKLKSKLLTLLEQFAKKCNE